MKTENPEYTGWYGVCEIDFSQMVSVPKINPLYTGN